MEVLGIVVCYLLFVIIAPIAVCISSIATGSVLVIISFLICILLITECYTYIKNLKNSIPLSVLLAFVYGFIYISAVDIFDDGWEKFSGFLLVECLNFPCYWIGEKLKVNIEQSLPEKKELMIERYNIQKTALVSKICDYENEIGNKKKYVRLLQLLDICGSDVSKIYDCKILSDCKELEKKINVWRKDIILVQEKIDNIENFIKRNSKRHILIFHSVVVLIVALIYLFCSIPYIKLKSEIKSRTLSAEQCSYSSDNAYYCEYIRTSRGRKLLANELTNMHQEDDIESALWLLCVQPDIIDGINLCISKTFSQWIVDYMKSNAISVTEEDDGDIIYEVNGYCVKISCIYSSSYDFYIKYGDDFYSNIEVKNHYHDGAVETIN